jgi:Protein kinase domain/Cellulose binding domain
MPVAEEHDMAAGDSLIAGRYRLVERVGSGSMGVVWRAHDERLDRTVAVKQLRPGTELTDMAVRLGTEQAMREARITARLQHPNAVTVHDVVEHDGLPCLVMEYLRARSLSSVLAQHGSLPPVEVARIGAQVADALAAAHQAGIVHRDVKPDNVLLTEDGVAKITDFGISRTIGDGSVTWPGVVVGTPAYLAPEVARGASADFASDVFSLGATLYTAVEGSAPFGPHENTIVLLQAVANGVIVAPRRAGGLESVLSWLLAADPGQRPDMVSARAALAAVAEGRAVVSPNGTLTLPAAPVATVKPRPKALVGALTAVGLVAAGVLAGVLITDGGSSADGVDAAGTPDTTHTGGVPPPSATPSEAPSATPSEAPSMAAGSVSTCTAAYAVTNSWPGGYQAQVTVTNAGGVALSGWTVSWQLPDGQTITSLWNGALSQEGPAVTVGNTSYNATMAANASTSFGFLGGGTGGTPLSVRCQAR